MYNKSSNENQKLMFGPTEANHNPMDKLIKTNRDMIILSMLLEKPMSGYDLIKEIFSISNILLSQGSVYPVLYPLEEEGIIEARYERGDMRVKKYHITQEGSDFAQRVINEFSNALHFVDNLILGRS